jgi:sporulation protein YlmC with PRC-barrel domain
MATTHAVRAWRGRELLGSDGEKLGTIDEIYLDAQTREPEWALVSSGVFGAKQSFVPLRDASPSGDGVSVPVDKSTVTGSPEIDPGSRLSEAEEAELYRHYGMDHSGRRVSGPTTDSSGPEISSEEHAVVLREEEVMAERRAVRQGTRSTR